MAALWFAALAVVFVAHLTPTLGGRLTYIVGGKPVYTREDYTFVGSLEYNGAHTCACVLISDNYALTAAHCATKKNMNLYKVLLGMKNRWTESPEFYYVTAIERHPWYKKVANSQAFTADIALLYLSREANFKNPYISKVHMATTGADYTGKSCTFVGWGKLKSGFTEPVQDRLHEANMTVYSDAACKSNHGDVINRGHVCAGSSGVAACDKDAGGPLFCKTLGQWELVGVQSWGAKSCNSKFPTVFVNIPFFRQWIHQVIGWKDST